MKKYKNELVGLCVGHSRKNDMGASSVNGMSEWEYNYEIAYRTQELLADFGVPCFVISDYKESDYSRAMNYVAAELKRRGATRALELHFNAYDGTADQEEYLYASSKGKLFAQDILDVHTSLDPNLSSRGLKERRTGRGSQFLMKTHCVACLAEPFFGDNEKDWAHWGSEEGMSMLAQIYAEGIVRNLNR